MDNSPKKFKETRIGLIPEEWDISLDMVSINNKIINYKFDL